MLTKSALRKHWHNFAKLLYISVMHYIFLLLIIKRPQNVWSDTSDNQIIYVIHKYHILIESLLLTSSGRRAS